MRFLRWLFGISKETVRTGDRTIKIDPYRLKVENGKVREIWSGARDTFIPHSIVFTLDGWKFELQGAGLLKNVCRAWKRDDRNIHFDAVLYVKGFECNHEGRYTGTIVKVEELS